MMLKGMSGLLPSRRSGEIGDQKASQMGENKGRSNWR